MINSHEVYYSAELYNLGTAMAFFNKAGSILRQAACSKNIGRDISASGSSIFQTIRCMSTKLFIGGAYGFFF